MQGREYIHIRRKINGKQRQKFINIDGLSIKEISIKKHHAKKIDKEWENEQICNDESIASLFCIEGKLKHIQIYPPQPNTDWSVKSVISDKSRGIRKGISRSIAKYGLIEAIDQVFDFVADTYGLKKRSITRRVLRASYQSHLKDEFSIKWKENKDSGMNQGKIINNIKGIKEKAMTIN